MNRNYVYILFTILIFALVSPTSYSGSLSYNRELLGNTYNTGISPGLELLIHQTLPQKKTKEVLQIKPHNQIGFNTDEAYVSDLSAYWNYTSVHYYRLTDCGKFGGHINYAKRYGSTGIQYQLEAYPKLFQKAYASLVFGYANTNQILYPNLQYMMEVYVATINNLEFSLGQGAAKYTTFSNQKILNYTGTIGKYIGNSFIWFRPRYFTPKQTMFFEIGLRKYFSDNDNYVSVVIGNGRLPDIGDVPPLDQMIIINQKGIGINGQLALTKTIFLQGGIGYVKQDFPSGLRREITDGSVGINWRF